MVVVEPQIGHAVLDLRDPLHAHAPGKLLNLLRVIARRVGLRRGDVGVDVRIDLEAPSTSSQPSPLQTEQREPSRRKPLPLALKAGHVDLDTRLGEREEVRAQAHVALARRRSLARTQGVFP